MTRTDRDRELTLRESICDLLELRRGATNEELLVRLLELVSCERSRDHAKGGQGS